MRLTDRESLLSEQYATSTNLNARMEIHQRFSTNPYGWHRWVFDQIGLPPEGAIMEMGCGSGALWTKNAGRMPGVRKLVLSDLSRGMVDTARRALELAGVQAMYMVADAQHIPLPDASVDALIANHMIYHIPDKALALSEMRRVLRPSGCLYAATNGSSHLRELEELILAMDPTFPYEHLDFVLETGAELLSQWFETVEVRCYPDALEVTEADLLMAYILSLPESKSLDEAQLAELRRRIDRRIESHGSYRITKSAGLFVAG